MAELWVRHFCVVRNAASVFPAGQSYQISYEDLSRSPVETLRGCTGSLGLEWDADEIVKAVEANQASNARANGGTRIPLFGEAAKQGGPVVSEPDGFIRKAVPGAWKDDLSSYEKFRVWRSCHEYMDAAGYSWPKPMESAFSCLSASMDLAKMVLLPRRARKKAT